MVENFIVIVGCLARDERLEWVIVMCWDGDLRVTSYGWTDEKIDMCLVDDI
jgi:hypothetical protein